MIYNNIQPTNDVHRALGIQGTVGREKGVRWFVNLCLPWWKLKAGISLSAHFIKCAFSWPAGPVPLPAGYTGTAPCSADFSGPGAEVEVMADAVLEANHSVQGCGCSWASHSGQEAGLEEEGAWSPQTLHLKKERKG